MHPIKTMARLYQKIYETDPICCPKCGGEMKTIGFITDQEVIRQILKHLGLWMPMPSRDPPNTNFSPKNHELVYEIFDGLSSIYWQMIGLAMMNPVLRKIKPFFTLLQVVGVVLPFFVKKIG